MLNISIVLAPTRFDSVTAAMISSLHRDGEIRIDKIWCDTWPERAVKLSFVFTCLLKTESSVRRVLGDRSPPTVSSGDTELLADFCAERGISCADLPQTGDVPLAGKASDFLLLLGNLENPERFSTGTAQCLLIDFEHQQGIDTRAFWPVLNGEAQTHYQIVRLTAGGSLKDVAVGRIPTQPSAGLNRSFLHAKSVGHLALVLQGLARQGLVRDPDRQFLPDELPPRVDDQMPASGDVLTYGKRRVQRFAQKVVRRLRGRRARWGVSLFAGPWRDQALAESTPLRNPPGRFLADPFLLDHGGQSYLFVEDYSFDQGKAVIALYRLDDDGPVALGTVLEEAFHLSFPFVFWYQDRLLMCPETSEAEQIRLYECTEFPMKWELHTTLIGDVAAADSMIFEHQNRWWMLTTMDSCDSGEICSELHLFSANNPMSQDWVAHPMNPIAVDSDKARNGGLISHDGKLIRVGQRQGFGVYGVGATLFEIDVLTEQHYAEHAIGSLQAGFREGVVGVHHMHSLNGITVFDHMSYETVSR